MNRSVLERLLAIPASGHHNKANACSDSSRKIMARKPRQRRAKATVDAIVEAGFITMAERGPAATTTRQIADIAGVGVGSIYEYFENKEEIFSVMSDRFIADTIAMIQPLIPELVRKPIKDAVLELLARFRDFLQAGDERYLKCARHAMTLGFEQHVEPLNWSPNI
jgi:AcrR family transcriptional regulator